MKYIALLLLLALPLQAQSQTPIKWIRASHVGGASSLVITPDDRYMVSTSERDDDIIVWSIESNSFVRRFNLPGAQRFYASAILNDGRTLLTSDQRGMQLIDLESGDLLRSVPVSQSQAALYVAASSTGDTVLFIGGTVGGPGRQIYRYSLAAERIIDSLPVNGVLVDLRHFRVTNGLTKFAYPTKEGLRIADLATGNSEILAGMYFPQYFISDSELVLSRRQYLHVPSLTVRDSLFEVFYIQRYDDFGSSAVTSDQKRGFIAYDQPSMDGTSWIAPIYEVDTANIAINTLSGLRASIIATEGSHILAAGAEGHTSYDLETGGELYYTMYEGIDAYAFRIDGERYAYRATGSSNGYHPILLISDRRRVFDASGCSDQIALDPVADRLAIGSQIIDLDTLGDLIDYECTGAIPKWSLDGSMFLWFDRSDSFTIEDRAGSSRSIASPHGRIYSLDISPNGSLIATAGDDPIIRLWTSSGTPAKELAGHSGAVYSVWFADNDRLVSAGSDKTIRVWDLASGNSSTIANLSEVPVEVQVSSEGSTVIVRTQIRSMLSLEMPARSSVDVEGNSASALEIERVDGHLRVRHPFVDRGLVTVEVFDMLGRMLHRGSHTSTDGVVTLPRTSDAALLIRVSTASQTATATVQ